MKTLAVIVTHNRCVLLSRCLDYLLEQTRRPAEILVINNASTDDTVGMLTSRNIPFVTQENVGSAGGWYRGIQYAIDSSYDAVWLMDDDGFPDKNALLVLENALGPGVGCASSVVMREGQATHFVFPFPILDSTGLPVIFGNPRKINTLEELRALAPGGTYPFAHFFNGALLSIPFAKKVGNVNRNFFIYGDEVDYFFRLCKKGRVISALDALHFHPDVSQRPFTPLKVYYYIKNTLILNTRYFNAVWLRHVLTVAAALVRVAHRNGLKSAFSYVIGRNSPSFYLSIFRGLRGKIGKDFNG